MGLGFDGPVATLSFHRPASRNALSQGSWTRLPIAVAQAVARRETRVIIVQGAGGNFAAGADISEFDKVFADRAATEAYLELMLAATGAIAEAPVPVLAAIEGLCVGAGVAVALACDVRVADPGASFAITPAKLGLAYSLTDTRRLAGAVGLSKAKQLLFTGERIDAAEALRIGLIDTIGDPSAADDLARVIAANAAASHSSAKRVLRLVEQGAVENDISRAIFGDAPLGDDFREGLAAFRAKRAPVFPPR